MVIFHSYVSLPEGNPGVPMEYFFDSECPWLDTWRIFDINWTQHVPSGKLT